MCLECLQLLQLQRTLAADVEHAAVGSRALQRRENRADDVVHIRRMHHDAAADFHDAMLAHPAVLRQLQRAAGAVDAPRAA